MTARILIYASLILLFTINLAYSQDYNFDVWAVRSGLFTIGKSEILQIYVNNTGSKQDSYTISYSKSATDRQGQDVSHLINVNFESNEIADVEPGEVKSTIATAIILGPIRDGEITFMVTNSRDLTKSYKLDIYVGYSIALSEFQLVGLLLLLAGLIYFKRTIV